MPIDRYCLDAAEDCCRLADDAGAQGNLVLRDKMRQRAVDWLLEAMASPKRQTGVSRRRRRASHPETPQPSAG